MAHLVRPAFSPAHEARLPARQSIDADNPYGGLCLPSAAGPRAISALRIYRWKIWAAARPRGKTLRTNRLVLLAG
jgi:hypothetical protein